jgi:hypothetical protein
MGAIGIDELEQLMRRGDYVNIAPDGAVTIAQRGGLKQELEECRAERDEQRRQLDAFHLLLDTPEIEDFDKAVPLEAAHQVKRWGAEHDEGKEPEDWFWLLGYLAGKALAAFKAGDLAKAKHHTISASAALRNWHAHIRTGESKMRPGISAEKRI